MSVYTCEKCSVVFTKRGYNYHISKENCATQLQNDASKENCATQLQNDASKENCVMQSHSSTCTVNQDETGCNCKKKIENTTAVETIDYTKKTITELKILCKEHNIRGISGKNKAEIITAIQTANIVKTATVKDTVRQDIVQGDTLTILPTLAADSAQIIIADPPYNIGKDFGNNSDKQPLHEYLLWCDQWIKECLRILKPNGTMFIYGFSENLALILSRVPYHINRRWIIWHYTNKNVPSLNFWQRSHESIIVLWKTDKVFHRDDIREAYTDGFLNGAAGKERKATKGRFSKGDKKTTYTAHEGGALPRDVIKVPALAGGAGKNERVDHPTQKPLALCDKLIRSCKQEDGYVLVPFAGSGSECVAAKKIGLPFIGIELNADYIKLINERLST
jgi:site-specific DNA-methyltransferase (adenine-specific)